MAVQREIFTQNLFVRGIGQSPYLPEQGAVADMEGVDVVNRYGVVQLRRGFFTKNSTENNVGGSDIVGTAYGRGEQVGTGRVNRNVVFFSNWSFVPEDGEYRLIQPTVNTATLGNLRHVVQVDGWGPVNKVILFIARITSGISNNGDGIIIYKKDDLHGFKDDIEVFSPANVPANLKGIYEYPLVRDEIRSVVLDGVVYISIANRIYTIEDDPTTGALTLTEKLAFDTRFAVVRMIPHGDDLHIYTSDRYFAFGQALHASKRKNYRFIWNRGTDAWRQQDEIPGTLFDAVNFKGIDMILWDDNIGYFNGAELVVLQKIPQVSGKIVRPMYRSASVSGGFITFLTMQLQKKESSIEYENDGTGITMWRYGKERNDNPLSLQKTYQYYAGYSFVDGEMVGNSSGDVFFSPLTGHKNIVESEPTEKSVQYLLFAQQKPSPSTDNAFLSFVQPFSDAATITDYVQSGYVTTQEIGREFREAKRLERIGVNASIPDNSQVKVSVAVDGSDSFTEVAVFGNALNNHQWMAVGEKGIVPFHTMRLKVELNDGDVPETSTPLLYGVSAEYERMSDVA